MGWPNKPTILFGFDPYWGALGPRAHVCVGPHPHLILCPLLQALQHVAGGFCADARHLVALGVLAVRGLVADSVAHDGAVATGRGRGHPTHLEAGGAETEQLHLLRGGGGRCKGSTTTRGGRQIKQNYY